jgi:hypothetical protein
MSLPPIQHSKILRSAHSAYLREVYGVWCLQCDTIWIYNLLKPTGHVMHQQFNFLGPEFYI